jgi:hypothetical protein
MREAPGGRSCPVVVAMEGGRVRLEPRAGSLHLAPLAGRGRVALAIRVRGYRALEDLACGERPLTLTLSP